MTAALSVAARAGVVQTVCSGEGHASQQEISEWVKKELEQGWQSKGYDSNDQKLDSEWHQLFCFCLISLPVIMAAIIAYLPDRRMRDWAIREVRSARQ